MRSQKGHLRSAEVIKGLILICCHGMLHFSELKLKMLVSGAGAALFCQKPESAPGTRTSGAAQKSGSSSTLVDNNSIGFQGVVVSVLA